MVTVSSAKQHIAKHDIYGKFPIVMYGGAPGDETNWKACLLVRRGLRTIWVPLARMKEKYFRPDPNFNHEESSRTN